MADKMFTELDVSLWETSFPRENFSRWDSPPMNTIHIAERDLPEALMELRMREHITITPHRVKHDPLRYRLLMLF